GDQRVSVCLSDKLWGCAGAPGGGRGGGGGGDVWYGYADHLNRPVALTDATKAVMGQYTWPPYGHEFAYGGPSDTDLRFLGQVFQEESGLFYNRFRHYDPTDPGEELGKTIGGSSVR